MSLSRLLGRNDAYIQQFIERGTPRRLAERDRGLIARYLNVSEAELGGAAAAARTEIAVRRLDVAAAAGAGSLASEDPDGPVLRFDPLLLRAMGVSGARAAMLAVTGDSMEPTLQDGDLILVDEQNRRVDRRGGIYVLRLDDALVVKRLRMAGDTIAILSDNPAFPAIEPRRLDEIDVVGRVAGLSRRC